MQEKIERITYDYSQALGQHGFFAFDQLKKLTTQEEAMKYVLAELDKVREMFLGDSLAPSLSVILNLEDELSKEIVKENNQNNFTRVMEIEDDLLAIKRVKSLINKNLKT